MRVEFRGIAPDQEKGWVRALDREDKCRLAWFRKNEAKINQMANMPLKRAVPQEFKDNVEKQAAENIKAAPDFPRSIIGEPDPPFAQSVFATMYPIDPEVEAIRNRKEKDGRSRYLKVRSKLIPDERYCLPETSNMEYGWKVWNKKATNYGLGREHVIKHTFYRWQGVHVDPDWYREPLTYTQFCTN